MTGIQTALDVFKIVEKTKEGFAHRAEIVDAMKDDDAAALALFMEELLVINTAQLKVIALILKKMEEI